MSKTTVKDLKSALDSRGISYDASMKKDDLVRRLEASEHKSKLDNMSRADIESLKVSILKDILALHGKATKATKKADLVNEVVSLNTAMVKREAEKQEEVTEKLKAVPLDAIRFAMKRLSVADQIRASIAFGDKDMIKELQAKRIDLPSKVSLPGSPPKSQDLTTMTRDQIQSYLEEKLDESLQWKLRNYMGDPVIWTLTNPYVTVTCTYKYDYRDEFTGVWSIVADDIIIEVEHVIRFHDDPSKDDVISARYKMDLYTADKDKLIQDMIHVRTGIHWIENYTGYTFMDKNQKKNPLNLEFRNIPVELHDPIKKSRVHKLILKEIKRVL